MPTRHPNATDDLYFGYGSNLDPDDWARFCARHGFRSNVMRPVERAILPNETLAFDYYSDTRACGALNIRPRDGEHVDGYLFAMIPSGWAILDRKEGHPHRYRRERVTAILTDGRHVRAQTYRVIESMRRPFTAPSEAYLAACRAGRRHFGLSTEQLERAAAGSFRSGAPVPAALAPLSINPA